MELWVDGTTHVTERGYGRGKSTVATALRELLQEVVLIEVDDIKVMVHGSPKRCDPERVFREAGAQARKAMDAGRDVVVIEPLCAREHFSFVLDAAGVAEAKILSVWLDCTLQTALMRKGRDFADSVIKHQHTRYATRYMLKNEIVIKTDDLSPSDVAHQVFQHFQEGVHR
jgi:predicted kinase